MSFYFYLTKLIYEVNIFKKIGFLVNVLIVEDNALIARIQQGFMKQVIPENARIDIAYDCQIAKELTQKNEYDIILVDFGLPDGHGLDLTIYLRGQGIKSLIVAVSGNLDEKTPEQRLAAGLDWGYKKPLMEAQAKDIIMRYKEKLCKKSNS